MRTEHSTHEFTSRRLADSTLVPNSSPSLESFQSAKSLVEATLYLKTEPALLDNFIDEFRGLNTGKRQEAHLEALAGQFAGRALSGGMEGVSDGRLSYRKGLTAAPGLDR